MKKFLNETVELMRDWAPPFIVFCLFCSVVAGPIVATKGCQSERRVTAVITNTK